MEGAVSHLCPRDLALSPTTSRQFSVPQDTWDLQIMLSSQEYSFFFPKKKANRNKKKKITQIIDHC